MQSTTKGSKGAGKRPASEADPESQPNASSPEQEGASDLKKLRIASGIAKLFFGSDIERIQLDTIRASNSKAHRLRGLVAVFVGGTNGIGRTTAIELFRHTTAPKAYIVGRDANKGQELVNELKKINSAGEAVFLQEDISELKNVDEVCATLLQREAKVNFLCLTAGYMSLKGRDENKEGIDSKMATNYYSRMRMALRLMPLLTAASNAGELSRVLDVLAAGSEGDIYMGDLDLRHNFSLHNCLSHCVVMTDFMMEELAKRFPGTSFSHSYPGTVKTGVVNRLTGPVRLAVKVMYAVASPWILNIQESGERHLFQMTSRCYPAATPGPAGIEVPEGLQIMHGTDGRVGSGAYLLDWDGRPTGDSDILDKYRALNLGKTVWDHTMQIFEQAELKTRGLDNPPSAGIDTGIQQQHIDPVGWRPA